jgi:hypothetical protein
VDELAPNRRDRLVSVAKATAAAVPYVGGVISELLTETIPELRLDRVVTFIRELDEEIRRLGTRLERFEQNLRSEQGIDLFEEGVLQASRSVSAERKRRLARLVARSLAGEELEYEQERSLLNLYRDLTDPEIIWLLFYSMNPVLGPGPHREWVEQHPDVLKPISKEMGAPQEQHERAAVQDLWKENLERFGLIRHRGKSMTITPLGRMLVRRIQDGEMDEDES